MDELQPGEPDQTLAVAHEVPLKRLMSTRAALGLIIGMVVAVAVGIVAVTQMIGSPLESAKDTCAPDSPHAAIGDGGDSLALRTAGRKSSGISLDELKCFMTELEVSDAITTEIGTTRALDGRQSADWDDYHASWTYHPDTGLTMVVTTA